MQETIMSMPNDVRNAFVEMSRFLCETLDGSRLSPKDNERRNQLIDMVKRLERNYPHLRWNSGNEPSSPTVLDNHKPTKKPQTPLPPQRQPGASLRETINHPQQQPRDISIYEAPPEMEEQPTTYETGEEFVILRRGSKSSSTGSCRSTVVPPSDRPPVTQAPSKRKSIVIKRVQFAAECIASKELYYCTAIWNCDADVENELSFKKGDKLKVTGHQFEDKGWLLAELNGKTGLVPKNYVERCS